MIILVSEVIFFIVCRVFIVLGGGLRCDFGYGVLFVMKVGVGCEEGGEVVSCFFWGSDRLGGGRGMVV